MLKRLRISQKLIIFMVLIGVVPLLIGIIIANTKVSNQLEEDNYIKLQALQQNKSLELEKWFKNLSDMCRYMTTTDRVITRFQTLKTFHDEKKVGDSDPFPVGTPDYIKLWDQVSPKLIEIQKVFGAEDLYLICAAHGHVMYSSKKERDLGANIKYGEQRESTLAKSWRTAVETGEISVADFSPYSPSGNEFCWFLSVPIHDETGKMLGTLSVRLPKNQLNDVMQTRVGLGETGENYLVGELDGQTYLRSDRVIKHGKIGDPKSDEFIKKALAGESGKGEKIGSTGKKEVLIYSPLNLKGLKWAMITTMDIDEVLAEGVEMRNVLLVTLLIIGVIVAIIGFFLARTISTPIDVMVDRAKDLAEGKADLTKRINVETKDELGELGGHFNRFIERIQELVQEVKKNAEGVSSASIQISSSTEELSATIEEQSSQTQSVSSAVTELAATSDDISKSIENTRSSAEESSQMTKDGGKIIQKAINSLKLIEKQTDHLGKIIGNLGNSTKKIGGIIDVINDVADQTNLLALNAAIEAARAGDAGRGFAVVADEVRKLAERTSKATKEIEEIITQLQQEATNAESAMKDASKEVENSTQLGQESLLILDKIVIASDKISNSAISVASAVTQENATIEEVNNNIQGIAAASEESSNAVQEVASTAEDLAKQAEKLKQMVDRFTA